MNEASNRCGDYGYRNTAGEPCRAHVIRGTHACKWHIGKSVAQAKANGALRLALDEWGINRKDYVDPGDVMLRLIAQSAHRVQRLSDAVTAAVQAQGDLNPMWQKDREAIETAMEITGYDPALAVLLAPDYAITKDGGRVYIGEKISALEQLEAQERDRCMKFCKIAIDAGLEERRVKAAEAQGMHLFTVIRLFTESLALSAGQREQVPAALRNAVAAVFGAKAVTGGELAALGR